MLTQVFIGMVLIGITVMFHAVALHKILKYIVQLEISWLRHLRLEKAFVMAIVALAVFSVLIVEIWVWALLYHFTDIHDIPDLETALYFSTAMFTTLGSGDVMLDKEWRLLGTIEGANGFLLFGWSTAFIFEVVSKVYSREGKTIEQ